ncbi:MAG: WYL domain-containing protein [Muribaculaceae bacterium]|nr:WYL domain-containing protein [Muribaculaceae bacterium]
MNEITFDKSYRVLYIYTELMCGHTISKKKLALQFHVNEKSIQRDLETIREFLDRKVGEEGYGSQLVYDFHKKCYYLEQATQSDLSNAEILAVSKILLASRAFMKQEMMTILDKLIKKCVPLEERKVVNDLLSNERFHYVELQHKKVFLDKLLPLGNAIREYRMISIKYEKLKNKTVVVRYLKPLAILFSEYYFYLVGFIENIDRQKAFENADDPFPTIYRIDRIQELEILEEHFKIPYASRFEEGEFRKRIQFMFGGKLQRVKLECKEDAVEAVLDRLPTAKIIKEDNGTYTILAEVFGKGIEMWVRSQGDRVRQIL